MASLHTFQIFGAFKTVSYKKFVMFYNTAILSVRLRHSNLKSVEISRNYIVGGKIGFSPLVTQQWILAICRPDALGAIVFHDEPPMGQTQGGAPTRVSAGGTK